MLMLLNWNPAAIASAMSLTGAKSVGNSDARGISIENHAVHTYSLLSECVVTLFSGMAVLFTLFGGCA